MREMGFEYKWCRNTLVISGKKKRKVSIAEKYCRSMLGIAKKTDADTILIIYRV